MKITSIDIIDVANDFQSATSKWRPVVVRINTDEGISGYGEVGLAYGVGASGGFGVARDLAGILLGMDPMRSEAIWEKMLRKTFWGQGGGGIFSAAHIIGCKDERIRILKACAAKRKRPLLRIDIRA